MRPLTTEQQRVELRATIPVEADNLAVEDGLLGPYCMCEFLGELRELVDMTLPGHQLAVMAADERERSETIVLELKQELLVIKRFGDAHQRHRVQGR
jgi:hypothetical protein